ncbi:uncharacterized protein PG986_001984 [Apiospora aurea]|uniref:DUF427 domain-containing protein n=1 Tax=Apiospora aurea TaxID=335848 RepID=A0ABR1QYD8_9PEZI
MPNPKAQPDLLKLGERLLTQGPVKTLRTPKRVRIQLDSTVVADTTSALYVWEHEYYPFYYVPLSTFREGALKPKEDEENEKAAPSSSPSSAPSPSFYVATLTAGAGAGGQRTTTDRVLVFSQDLPPNSAARGLAGLARVEFSAPGAAWFEEDERIYVHPRDPYKRIDILPSTRPVRVFVEGRLVASAPSSMHLYETGLPVRYYLPATALAATDDGLGLVRESGTTTQCPYKGEANYYSVVLPPGKGEGKGEGEETVVKDVIWYYRTPTHESARVAGLLCFYNEKVDIELDGKMLERPTSIFA